MSKETFLRSLESLAGHVSAATTNALEVLPGLAEQAAEFAEDAREATEAVRALGKVAARVKGRARKARAVKVKVAVREPGRDERLTRAARQLKAASGK